MQSGIRNVVRGANLRRLRSLAAAALAVAVSAMSARAGTLYWDGGTINIVGNGNGVSAGGAGDWDNTLGENTLNWDQGANLSHVAWTNANLDTAFFGGTAGTVTLTDPIVVGGLTFLSSTGYTLTAGTEGLSFGATNNTIRLVNSSNGTTSAATISGTVGGTGNVILTSINPVVTSTLTFNGTSTGGWSGTTTVNQNFTVALAASSQALLNTSGITLNGGNITLTNTTAGEALLNRVSNGAGITSRGGNFTFTNTAASGRVYAETIGSVGLVNGQTNFLEATNQGGGGGNMQTLTLSGLTRTGATNTSAVSFGSASGLNTSTNIIQVTGASGTGSGSGQIIGPWAFYGTTPASPTDYAVYDASGNVLNASIGATAENSGSWVGGANVTLNAPTTLTATRTVNTLRYSGAAGNLDLGASNFNLETYGLLNGGSGLTVQTTGTGALTTPTGGGQLYITPGAAAITVSAPIKDNSGAVTLVKSGSGTLTLSNTGNNYTGGTVLNAGTLAIGAVTHIGGASANLIFGGNATLAPSAALNFSGGTLTVNEGANATIANTTAAATTFATTTGSGNVIYATSSNSNILNLGNASGLTGNLYIRLTGNANYVLGTTVQFSSLGDGVGSALQFTHQSTDSNQALTAVLSGGSAPLVFNNRQIQALPRLGSNNSPRYLGLSNNNASPANTWTINTDLFWEFTHNGLVTNRELRLGGGNSGDNAFNGLIGEGQNEDAVTLNLTKIDGGKWIIGHTANTYDGFTDIRAGTLEIKSIADGGLASSIGVSSNAAGNLLLGNGTILRYTGSGHSTDRSFTINGTAATHQATIESSGTGALNLTSTATLGYGTVDQTRTLNLGGTNTGANTLAASLANNGTGVVTFDKEGAGRWILSGTNTYTGVTTVNGGILQFAKEVALYNNTPASWLKTNIIVNSGGTIAFNVGGVGEFTNGDITTLLGNLSVGINNNGLRSGSRVGFDTTNAVGTFTVGDLIANSTGTGSGAVGLTKLGTGTLALTNSNTYTGATIVNEGTLLVNGSTAAGSAVTVNTGATLGGTGAANGAVLVNTGGFLSPGASIESLSSGALTMNSGSTFEFESLDNSASGADLMVVNGALSLTDVLLDLSGANLAANTWVLNDKLTLISYTGSGITNGFIGYVDDTAYAFGLNSWTINYNDLTKGSNFNSEATGSRFVTLTLSNVTFVPEPGSMALLGLGLMLIGGRRRAEA